MHKITIFTVALLICSSAHAMDDDYESTKVFSSEVIVTEANIAPLIRKIVSKETIKGNGKKINCTTKKYYTVDDIPSMGKCYTTATHITIEDNPIVRVHSCQHLTQAVLPITWGQDQMGGCPLAYEHYRKYKSAFKRAENCSNKTTL
jgi:hypothetical protein